MRGLLSTRTVSSVHTGLCNRAAGGCTDGYHPDDLAHVRCYVCGKHGHLSCGVMDGTPDRHTALFNMP